MENCTSQDNYLTPLILVTGPSGCGKSSLACAVVDMLLKNENREAIVLHQDHYFTKPFIECNERVDMSYEDASGVDWARLTSDIKQSMIENRNRPIIVEGHMLGVASSLLCRITGTSTVAVLIHCNKTICKNRRLERKTRTKEESDILEVYIDKYVWPAYLQYGVPAMTSLKELNSKDEDNQIVDIVEIDGGLSIEWNKEIIAKSLQLLQ